MTTVPEWANWLVRDKDDKLCAYEKKPFALHREEEWISESGDYLLIEETDDTFSHIKWTDEEPTKVESLALPILDRYNIAISDNHEHNELPKLSNPDMVNHPNHYKQGGLETIDIMHALLPHEQFVGYLKGNIIKYRERAEHKGNAEQDYAKAKWYYDKLMEVEE